MENVNLKPCPLCGREVKWASGSIKCDCGLSFRQNRDFCVVNDNWNNRKTTKTRECVWIKKK